MIPAAAMSDHVTSNPYAPPQSAVADPPALKGLKRRSVLVMIVLTIVTFGVYHILWYFLRRPALNQLDSPRKLPLWPLCAHATALTLSVVADAVSFPEPRAETIGAGGALFLSVALLATSILMIVMSFRIKDMLEDHLAGPEEVASLLRFSQRVSLSGLMTFFFSIYYLQHVINRHVLTAEAERQLRAT